MKHDLLQMEYPTLLKPKGFRQGSTIVWEVKSFEGLSAQIKKCKLLNLEVDATMMFFLLWIPRWKAKDNTIIALSVLRNWNFWTRMNRENCKCNVICIRNRGDFEE